MNRASVCWKPERGFLASNEFVSQGRFLGNEETTKLRLWSYHIGATRYRFHAYIAYLQEQCAQYWPSDLNVTRQYKALIVEMTQVTETLIYTRREFSLTNTNTNEKRAVWHYQHSDWPEKHGSPNPAAIIELIEVIKKAQNVSGGPVLVHDR